MPMAMLAGNVVTIGGIKYDLVSKTKEATVINGGNYIGDIVIPSTLNYYGTNYSVTNIAIKAFQDCNDLTSITIPSSIKSIGSYAFRGCTNLTTINISNGVTDIGGYAFSGCKSLSSITIPNSVTTIDNYLFFDCSGLRSINIPNSVTSIENNAFQNCMSLNSITIPSSVTSIGENAFQNCNSMTSVSISNGVKTIESLAFNGCTQLTSIIIPKSVTSIGNRAFQYCFGLTSIVVASGNSVYDSRNNCNAIIEKTSNTLVVGCKNSVIPENVIEIGQYAFFGISTLTTINIPNSVETIGADAFRECSNLSYIIIPNSVTKILNGAFNFCSNLRYVDLGNGITEIRGNGFANCNELEYVICRASSVPNAVSATFNNSYINKATLVVPNNSLTDYKNVDPWSNFGTFLSLSTANVIVIANNYTREYGNVNPTFDYIANMSLLNGTPSLTCTATETSSPGNYTIKVSKGSVTNTKILLVDGTLTVTKAPLTIEPNDYIINVGDPIPTFDATYKGLKNDETDEVLSPVFSCTASDSNTPGVYDITVSAISDNYDITIKKGTLTIQPTIATITISDVGVATYCFDFGLDFSDVTDFKAYIATGYNRLTGNVIVQPIKEAPGGIGLYIKGKPGTYQLPIYDSDSYYVNMLEGVTTPTTIYAIDGDYTNFVLYATNSSDACFRPLTDSYNLKANRAYLQIPTSEVANSAGANYVWIEYEEETTGIEENLSTSDMTNCVWYSLNGQKLNGKPSRKGVYVINGRKVVIK